MIPNKHFYFHSLQLELVLLFILFMAAASWAKVGDIVASGYCGSTANGADGKNLSFILSEQKDSVIIGDSKKPALMLKLTGSGAMEDNPLWHRNTTYRQSITSICFLPKGLSSIGDFAFAGLVNFKKKSLSIPWTVESIGERAFSQFNYDNLRLSSCIRMTRLSNRSLHGYEGNVSLPPSLTIIEPNAFT